MLQKATGSIAQGRNATADRAIDVLLLFGEQQPTLTAEEVSKRLGMPRSTTYRYLQSLRSHGLIEESDVSGGFRLGPSILRLARVARTGLGICEIALPVMRTLTAQTGESTMLTRRSGQHVVCIELVETTYRVRPSYERGQVLPLHAGASAKVLLAFLEPTVVASLLSTTHLARYTDRTITDPEVLRAQLEIVRANGYSLSEGEIDAGVRGIAAPIFDTTGQVLAGLSVVGPEFRLDDAFLPTVIYAVREATQTISRQLRDLDT